MNEQPLISVIIPCYNQGEYLNSSISSILNQSYSKWECIIVDDGSTDNTAAVAKKLCKLDDRIQYLYKANGGLSSARNAGLEIASGNLVQFLDADDLLTETKFETSVDLLNDDQTLEIVICDFIRCNFDNTIKIPAYCDLSAVIFNFESILLDWDLIFTIPIHCGLFKSELLNGYKFNEAVGAKEDWLMWLHVFSKSPAVAFLNSPLAIYREHEASMSFNRTHMYVNTLKAFAFVIDNMLDDKLKKSFFYAVNNYWHNEVQLLQSRLSDCQNHENTILQSPAFKIGKALTYPIRGLRSLISKSQGS